VKASTAALVMSVVLALSWALPGRASSGVGASVHIGMTEDAARVIREWRRARGLDRTPEPSAAQVMARNFAAGCLHAGGGVLDTDNGLICL